MNPVLELSNVARKIAALGDKELAARVRAAASKVRLRQAASTDIVLDSWSEFESWFLKNRSQGLEFVFEDQYGADSEEVVLLRQLLEGYDFIERKTHDLYEMLRTDTPTPAPALEDGEEPSEDTSIADDVEASDAAEAESLADVIEEVADPDAAEGEEAAAEGEATEEEVTSEEAAAEEEAAPTEAEEAAEEALAPAKAEASVKSEVAKTAEAKTITRLTKLLRKAKVETVGIAFSGNNSYRVQFPDTDSREAAVKFFEKTGMTTETVDHPVKVFLSVTP